MHYTKWYYSTWFVAFLFALWFLIVPIILGIHLISKQKKDVRSFLDHSKSEKQQEFNKLKEELYGDIENQIKVLQKEVNGLEKEVLTKQKEYAVLNLLFKLKLIAIKQENQHLKEQSEKFLEESRIRHQQDLENDILARQTEICLLSLISKLKLVAMQREIRSLKENKDEVLQDKKNKALESNKTLHRKCHQLLRLKRIQNSCKKEIVILKDELLFQSFGFYDLHYDLEDSQEYKEKLDDIRIEQKQAVKSNMAVNYNSYWLLDNSQRKGQAMNKKNIKMTIRSFNNECDTVIHKVKFNNIESSEQKIRKAREQLNNLNSYNQIEITSNYLDLKLQELYLAYEYAKKKNDEKEEQRHRNELLREQLRAQKEVEERLKVLMKEKQHFQNALESYLKQLVDAEDGFSNDINREIQKIQIELKKIEEESSELDYRVRNSKAGFVYVISNLGAFGENVFKIGMTRRLEPLDRIRELSGASVPFPYDVHAMIFTEDAPALESELHKAFNEKRVNKMNNRKEFFRVPLKEIEKVVRENYYKPVEFIRLGIAQEYRETMMFEKREAGNFSNTFHTVS